MAERGGAGGGGGGGHGEAWTSSDVGIGLVDDEPNREGDVQQG